MLESITKKGEMLWSCRRWRTKATMEFELPVSREAMTVVIVWKMIKYFLCTKRLGYNDHGNNEFTLITHKKI